MLCEKSPDKNFPKTANIGYVYRSLGRTVSLKTNEFRELIFKFWRENGNK